MAEFSVSDPKELHALVRALIEAKLPRQPRDTDVAASPIVAELAERATNARQHDSDATVAWRTLDANHSYWSAVISRAVLDASWLRKCTPEQRRRHVRLLAVPFHLDDTALGALVHRVENVIETRSYFDVWLRAAQPDNGGVLISREQSNGTIRVFDQSKREVATLTSDFELCDWFVERDYQQIGRYLDTSSSD